MNRRFVLLGILFATFGIAPGSAAVGPSTRPFSADERAQGYSERVILAKPRAQSRNLVDAAESRERVRVRERFARLGDLRVIELDAGDTVAAAIARLRATGRYEFVEPDYLMMPDATPNDPSYPLQWSLNNTGQIAGATVGVDIKAPAAWDVIHDAPNVIVAIVDGGVRLDHQDIAPNLWVNPAPTIGDVNGISILRGVRSANLADEDGHGSHVAGIICASGNNGIAIAGIAWRTQLMVLKNAGADGSSATSDSAACIDYAVAHGAQVINCSFGGTSFSQTMFTAIRAARDAGVIVVTSAGNSGLSNDVSPHYPSNYLLDNIVAVGNSVPTDAPSASSDFGATVELFAPGTVILSLDYTSTTGTISKSGTSMAAPHVTGAMVLLRAQFPNDTYRQLINRLLRGAEIKTALAARALTNGRLNLPRALATATNRPFNDDLLTRALVTGSNISIRSNNRGATAESGEPAHAGVPASGSLWWQWIAPASGTIVADTSGSDFDTVLAVYTNSSTATSFSTFVPVASNDDNGTAQTSRVSFAATALSSYYIVTAGKAGSEGYTQLNLAIAPANDNFADATPLSGLSAQAAAQNNSATLEPGEPRILGFGGGASLWYKWIAPRDGRFQVSAFTFDFDALVAVYSGSSLGNLALVAAGDDTDLTTIIKNSDSRCNLDAVAGLTYYIQVDTKSSSNRGKVYVSVTDSLWQLSTDGGGITGAPSVAPDGTLYIGTISPDRRLYAVAPDGTLKWTYTAGGSIDVTAPAIGSDGTLYFGASDGKVTALTPAGAVRWQRDLAGGSASDSPALAADGTLYLHTANGFLYALASADGATKWQFKVNALATFASAVIAPDGTIYQGSDDQNLYALNPNGTPKWQFNTGGNTFTTPALDAAGNIYFATYNTSRVISLAPDGTLRWTYSGVTGTNAISGSPTLSADGTTVYIGAADKKLHAIDAATGAARWTYTTGNSIFACTPAVDTNGVIYIGAYDGKLYAINSTGTLNRTWDTAQPIRSSPAIFGSTLYVGSLDAKLYAFDIGAYAAAGPWPQYRHNVRHLGRAVTDALAITVPPQARNATAGDALSLSVTTVGQGPLSFQWFRNGAAIAGATSATFALLNVSAPNAGSYTVAVTGPQGTLTSSAAEVAIATPLVANPGRLINLSVLTDLTTAVPDFTAGIVVGGAGTSGTKALLVRAAGPALGALGVPGTLPDPKLDFYAGQTVVASNDDWAGTAALGSAMAQVGAFPYASASSKDSALFNPAFAARDYTVKVSGAPGATGTVIAEIYDATPAGTFTPTSPRLVNVSVLKQIAAGSSLTLGFTIGGATSKTVLIRAIGPALGLAPFNIAGAMADPQLTLFNSNSVAIKSNNDWAGDAPLLAAITATGAFPIANSASKDAMLVVTLAPGGYTAQASGVGTSAGFTIVEVYEVP